MYKILALLLVLGIIFCGTAFAEKKEGFEEGMTHEEFAMALVEELGLESMLPPAAVTQDYFDLLADVGIEPSGGWDGVAGVVVASDLPEMVGLDASEAAGMDFEELVELVIETVEATVEAITESTTEAEASPSAV